MSILNRPKLFSEDITLLETETHLKRMMQFAVSTSAVIFPLASLLLPNQKTESRLWEMGLGSLLGIGSTILVSSRQTLEKKHQAFVGMDTMRQKASIPLNQQIGRFLRTHAPSKGMYLTTPQAYRAYERYQNLNAVAELFYGYYDQERDDEQKAIDELTEEDFDNYSHGIR